MLRFVVTLLALSTLFVVSVQGQDWHVSLYSHGSVPAIRLSDHEGPSKDVTFLTNNRIIPGVGIRYRHYGVDFSQGLSGVSRDDPELPPTKFVDLRTYYHGGRYGVEIYHQYFRGFSLEDVSATSAPSYSSMSERTFNLNVFRGATKGSKVYHISEGIGKTGFKANLYYLAGISRLGFRSPVPLTDSTTDSSQVFGGMESITAYGLFAGLGSTLNLNLGGFYLDPTLFIGGGPQYRQSNVKIDENGAQVKVHLQFRTGFRGERFDIGMAAENDLNSIELPARNSIDFHSIAVKIHAGLSF